MSAIDQYIPLIHKSAADYNIPPSIFESLVRAESSGNAYAVSSEGAKGLAQLMPIIYRENEYGGLIDPFNPAQNLDRGAAFLSDMYKKYGNWTDALSHYNAGFNLSAAGGYAKRVLAAAGVDDSQSGGSSVLERAVKMVGEFAKNPFRAVPGGGTAAQVADSNTVWDLIESIASEKFVAALKKIKGGLGSVVLWIAALFLGYLAVVKTMER